MYLLFDIGGTNMRLGISADGKSIAKTKVVPTSLSYEEGLKLFIETGKVLLHESGEGVVKAIAGGIAGPISQKNHTLTGSPHLSDWIGRLFTEDLEKAFGAPAYIENDSAVVALGEAVHGAGKGFEIVAYITVSTGVGGARIVGGKIDERSIGFEPGHQIVDQGKTLESQISGNSVLRNVGKEPKEITDAAFWGNIAKTLAYGLNNTIVHWSPDVVILGGSMITGDPAIPLDATEKYLHEILKIYSNLPAIKMAELGDQSGLYGGLELIKSYGIFQ